jgi:phosphopantothenoylcysteine synthetase/decarboxylase
MAKTLSQLNILLGVTGGIAAYKAVDLASKLTSAGAKVNCILTRNATKLIRPKSFEAITSQPVLTGMWKKNTAGNNTEISHISVAQKADIIIIAPATANIIGKVANGICDDLLSTTLCGCWNKTVLIAPAMNNNMWENPAVQKNLETLKGFGFHTIGPETGRLACGDEAIGRMAEPADMLAKIEQIASEIN